MLTLPVSQVLALIVAGAIGGLAVFFEVLGSLLASRDQDEFGGGGDLFMGRAIALSLLAGAALLLGLAFR